MNLYQPDNGDPEDISDLVRRQAAPDPGEDEGREVRRGEGQGDRHPENRMDVMTPYKGGHTIGLCSRHRPPQHSNPAVGLPLHSPPGSGEYSRVRRIGTQIPAHAPKQSGSAACTGLMNEDDVSAATCEAHLGTVQSLWDQPVTKPKFLPERPKGHRI